MAEKTTTPLFEVRDASVGYQGREVAGGVNFEVHAGEIISLLGPNGVGKTTLLKACAGLNPFLSGDALLDGQPISSLSRTRLARRIGYVPQGHSAPFAFTALEVVLMGRTARLGPFRTPGPADTRAAENALEELGVGFLRDRDYTRVSGGERQMILVARAIAQEPDLLLMDEPTASLDLHNQSRVLTCARQLAEKGMGIVMTTHTPDQVFQLNSTVALLRPDGPFLCGPTDEVATAGNLTEVYGVPVEIMEKRLADGSLVRSCLPLLGDSMP